MNPQISLILLNLVSIYKYLTFFAGKCLKMIDICTVLSDMYLCLWYYAEFQKKNAQALADLNIGHWVELTFEGKLGGFFCGKDLKI